MIWNGKSGICRAQAEGRLAFISECVYVDRAEANAELCNATALEYLEGYGFEPDLSEVSVLTDDLNPIDRLQLASIAAPPSVVVNQALAGPSRTH